ncbi:MAG: hypothetical protein ACRDL2_10345 [Gaiellaceae bacterium]
MIKKKLIWWSVLGGAVVVILVLLNIFDGGSGWTSGQRVSVDGGIHGDCRSAFSPQSYEVAVCSDGFSVTCWGLGTDSATGLDRWLALDSTGKLCVGAKKVLQST